LNPNFLIAQAPQCGHSFFHQQTPFFSEHITKEKELSTTQNGTHPKIAGFH
jgi:hypothetical protein